MGFLNFVGVHDNLQAISGGKPLDPWAFEGRSRKIHVPGRQLWLPSPLPATMRRVLSPPQPITIKKYEVLTLLQLPGEKILVVSNVVLFVPKARACVLYSANSNRAVDVAAEVR